MMPGIGVIFSWLGSFLAGPFTALTGQFFNYKTSTAQVEEAEYGSYTAAQTAEYIAAQQAVAALNAAKVANNQSTTSHYMVLAFGLPPAIYLGSVYISASFPQLGWGVYALKGSIGATLLDMAKTIALSFFLYAPTMALTSWVKGGK